MPSSFLRGAVVGAVALTAVVTPAQAAPVLLGAPSATTDATSDGRYVLVAGGVLDRTTGATLPLGTGTPLALADRAPRVLVDTGSGLVVRDLAAGTEQAASVDTDGKPVAVSATRASLVSNGQTVVFTTLEATPRVIERNLSTNVSSVRLTGATLSDASEDGTLITFTKPLAAQTRAPGSASVPGEPASVGGSAVGYQQRGQASRIVETSTWTQTFIPGFDTGACSERVAEAATSTPVALNVSQDGQGRYAFYVTRIVASGSEIGRGGHSVIDRVTGTGTTLLADAGNPSVRDQLAVDPVSGAYALIHTTHGSSPLFNEPRLVAQDGSLRELGVTPVDGPGGTFNETAFYTAAVPIKAGAGAVYSASPNTADSFKRRPGTYVNEGAAPGATAGTPWLTLPRSVDAVDGPAVKPAVSWANCGAVAAPATIADYAAVTLKTTGNSAGSVAVTTSPAGKTRATSVTATVSWLGLTLATRRATADTTLKLPAIPVGLPGVKLTLVVKLASGESLRSVTALRRTR